MFNEPIIQNCIFCRSIRFPAPCRTSGNQCRSQRYCWRDASCAILCLLKRNKIMEIHITSCLFLSRQRQWTFKATIKSCQTYLIVFVFASAICIRFMQLFTYFEVSFTKACFRLVVLLRKWLFCTDIFCNGYKKIFRP